MDKNLIKKAIRSTEKYSASQYKVFDVLVDLSINDEINASVRYLMDRSGLTMPTVYTALRLLQRDKVLIKNAGFSNSYSLNKEKLEQVLELHRAKQ